MDISFLIIVEKLHSQTKISLKYQDIIITIIDIKYYFDKSYAKVVITNIIS